MGTHGDFNLHGITSPGMAIWNCRHGQKSNEQMFEFFFRCCYQSNLSKRKCFLFFKKTASSTIVLLTVGPTGNRY